MRGVFAVTVLFETLLRGNFRCGRMLCSRAPHRMARRGAACHAPACPRTEGRGPAIWNL